MKIEKIRENAEYLEFLAATLFPESGKEFIRGVLFSLIKECESNETNEYLLLIANKAIELIIDKIKDYTHARRKVDSSKSMRDILGGFKELLLEIGELQDNKKYYSKCIRENLRDLSKARENVEEKYIQFLDFWWEKIIRESLDPRNRRDEKICELEKKLYERSLQFEKNVESLCYHGKTIRDKLYENIANLISSEIVIYAIGRKFKSPKEAYETGYNLVLRNIISIVKHVIEEIEKYDEICIQSTNLADSVKRMYENRDISLVCRDYEKK
jgi:hypothetical protein